MTISLFSSFFFFIFFNLILKLLNPHLLLQIYGGNHGLKSKFKVFFVVYLFIIGYFFLPTVEIRALDLKLQTKKTCVVHSMFSWSEIVILVIKKLSF